MKDLISVIVPVYNVEKYLERCINSILQQTYQNIEIILIDDGSIDKSAEICDYYNKKDKRISVIHKKNTGVSSTRNQGLNIAKGKYLICIDSDDWLEKNMIETLYKNINKYDADLSVCNFYINENKKQYTNDLEKQRLIIEDLEQMYEFLFDKSKFGGYLWNKLIKKSIIDENNIRFDEKIKVEEDVMFLIKVLKTCKKIVYDSNQILYHYSQRSNSAVRFNYTMKDITKLYTLEEKLKLKEQYDLHSLKELEYEYVFLLKQATWIIKRENVKNEKLEKKIRIQISKYYKTAIKGVNFTKKIKLLAITISPKFYGKIMLKKNKIINSSRKEKNENRNIYYK